MSDIIDLESNNLCAPEDAFEKFQAVSMYEEDEYITLSDIVSPPRTSNDISDILKEVPADDVPGSLQDPGLNVNISTPLHENQVQEESECISTVQSNITTSTAKKRGRKKKNGYGKKVNKNKSIENRSIEQPTQITVKKSDTSLNTETNSKLNDNMDIREAETQALSDNTKQKITKPRRKAKTKNDSEETKDNSEKILSKRGRVIKRKIKDIDLLDALGDENKKVSKKRGRKKKVSDISLSPKPLSNNDTNLVEMDTNMSTTDKPGDDKDFVNEAELMNNDLEEDIPLVALSTKSSKIEEPSVNNLELSTDNEQKSLNDLSKTEKSSDPLPEKTPKKRGRPRKTNTDSIPANKLNLNSKECEQPNLSINDEDISLSKLKGEKEISESNENRGNLESKDSEKIPEVEENLPEDSALKRILKMPTKSDFEYNIDSIIKNDQKCETEKSDNQDSLLNESSRPVRRKAKKHFDYDEGSDEDPYANVESSDDESPRRKKGSRYMSDDEYIPGRKRQQSDLSDSDIEEEEEEEFGKQRKRKGKKLDLGAPSKSPKKRGRKVNGDKTLSQEESSIEPNTLDADLDIEVCLNTSVIKNNDESSQKKVKEDSKKNSWGEPNEFQNFLAKIAQGTDIKIKKAKPVDSEKTPLKIPVLDPTENKKIEMFTQTNITTKAAAVQTNTLYEIPMKNQVPLTAEQSEKACEFLAGIVKTTSELGQLMTQKSEDFIEKKINTKHVTDTFKMDYCVKKSFLLFKLAKHNLVQMEEDLAKHYEEFLKANDLLKHREEQKVIASTSKTHSGDSDCEIVEEPVMKKEKEKPAFNPKTVFLNKELSIKIAKKPTEKPKPKEKLNIKGRHTVWINDSVMVKKVKPTQSFLAQDSRNKKPPDTFVTLKMVSDFFKMYERQKAVLTCAQYIRNEWFHHKNYLCYYFLENSNGFLEGSQVNNEQMLRDVPTTESETPNLIEMKPEPESNKKCPQSLCFICMQAVQKYMCLEKSMIANTNQKLRSQKVAHSNVHENNNVNIENQNITFFPIYSLQTLCYKTIKKLIYHPNFSEIKNKTNEPIIKKTQNVSEQNYNISKDITYMENKPIKNIKSLFSLCVELIQKLSKCEKVNNKQANLLCYNPNSLQKYTLDMVKKIHYDNIFKRQAMKCKNIHKVQSLVQICIDFIVSPTKDYRIFISDKKTLKSCVMSLRTLSLNKVMALLNNYYEYDGVQEDIEQPLNFTIDNVNTISEDMFLEDACESYPEDIQNDPYTDNEHGFSDDDRGSYGDEYREDDNNWVSQVQMQELRSCTETAITNESDIGQQLEMPHGMVNIKLEPMDEIPESIVDSSTIKVEPEEVGEINFTPLDVITKQENATCTSSNKESIQRKNSNSYDVDAFESFVAKNKMILSMINTENDEVYSQSASRIRRQFEPDLDSGIETYTDAMNLLIPQNVEVAKDRLMQSSSDEDDTNKKEKKKQDKRKLKTKKTKKDLVQPNKEKEVPKNDVAVLTRKMRDKIRQEEKKNQSSDSELDDMTLNLRKEKGNKDKSKKNQLPNASPEKEIQCNDVDSTEKIDENVDKIENEGNENVIDGITDGVTVGNIEPVNDENSSSSVKIDGPIELIECQPTMPILENYNEDTSTKLKDKKISKSTLNKKEKSSFIDRHGWKCYPIDGKDSKIYQYAYVSLDKLPESFVETYFRYQDVTGKNQDDAEVERLTNLNSLQRTLHTQTKDKSSGEVKGIKKKSIDSLKTNLTEQNLESQLKVEPSDELSPSEDERDDYEDNVPLSPAQSSENCLAKDSLMDDDSDSEKLQDESNTDSKADNENGQRTRSGRLVKSKEKLKSEDLMLTADKMMNKELTLLHAPVEIKAEFEDKKDIIIKPTKNAQKNSEKGKIQTKKETKDDDDSSSEEEKQWFTTKEKLLKRLQKKQEIPNVDDAKRAKIVSEFIEKRGDSMETRQRGRPRRRSKKKLLERRKQMKILSRELFGDEGSHTGKKYSQASVSKGRRNIRKVLDKKSLGRSTVIANMEEFERKRRLSQRQAQLREVLGCEEGVNVVVINDELCLEYDFEEQRPVVSVHPFFTKVMKAHQYEGVKFMWDACFESVSAVASGQGGGCILAHCMGLGKTLQVLALLHTVLTHPQVGMRRVLVCCPLSTVLNWVDEINKWIGPVTNKIKQRKIKRKLQVFELSKLKKTYERAYQLEDWYNGGGIFIIGYELFRSLTTLDPMLDNVRPTIVNKIRMALLDPGPDMVICDEGHLLKNDCSVLAVAMSRVVTKRRIILTGTPMQNNLREYYCMVNFVKPNLLGTYSEYSNRFENPIMNGQHRDSREEDIKLMKARTHILHKVLEGCLQRQEASVLYPYLPKKHEYTVFITLTQCQRELYCHYLANYTKETKQSVLKDFHVLQKIWTHPQVLHNFLTRARGDEKDEKIKVEKLEDDLAHEDLGASEDVKPGTTETWWLPHVADDALHHLRSSNKFLVVFRLLDECVALGDKVLIFSTSLYTMDSLEFFLRARGWALGREYYRLDGSVPAEVRQKWCREFNAPNNTTTKLFLISTRAGCLGLNMTAANRVIILDTSWNPAHDIQSIFRVYRFGQKKDCYIYRLVAMGTMEQKIYERSVTKQAVACRVVDEQQIDRHYNMSDLSELYKLDEAGSSVSAGLAAGVRDAALLRVAGSDEGAALHAVHEHDSLLRGSSESGLNEHERAAAWMQFQQEHTATHTKIQNIEIKLSESQKKSEDKILLSKETENQADQSKSTSDVKPKRGRKSAANSSLDPQPSTSRQTDPTINPDAEETMIKKIMGILIKHNFHTTKTPQEISDLVVNVRNVVTNAKRDGLEHVNPLIASIAKVLLQNDGISIPEPNKTNSKADVNKCSDTEATETIVGMPYDDDTTDACENEEQDEPDEPDLSDRKRRRQRRLSDEEYVPEPSQRKKKITATDKPKTRKSNTNNLSVSSDDNSLIPSEIYQTEVVPIEVELSEPVKPQLVNIGAVQKIKKKMKNDKIKTEPPVELQQSSAEQIIPSSNTGDESILLSDDDDEPLVTAAKGTLPDKSKESSKSNKEDDDPVPLDKALLTNANFIKIVAHTYLSGNPMLDEDAAILAAQYSTLKALKETKATGKEITSGPIYDIAVQVLGKSLLKKLNNVRVNKNDLSATIKLESVVNQNSKAAKSSKEPDGKNDVIPETTVFNVKENKSRIKKKRPMESSVPENIRNIDQDTNQLFPNASSIEVQQVVSLNTATPVIAPAQDVVPVGMFKGPASFHSNSLPASQDECILPDDDDVIISPPTITTSTTPTVPPIIITNASGRRHSKQIEIKSVVTESAKTTRNLKCETITKPTNAIDSQQAYPSTSKPNIIIISSKHQATNIKANESLLKQNIESKNVLAAETAKPKASTQPNETICLDSDDEDAANKVTTVKKPVRKAVKSTAKPTIPRTETTTQKKSSTPAKMEITSTSHKLLNNVFEMNKNVSTVPLLSNPKNNIKVADTIIKQVKPKDTQDKQAEASNANLLTKASCKPGDIIRITETGNIEVLRRTEKVPTPVASVAVKNVTQPQTSEVEFITDDIPAESLNISKKIKEKADSNNRSLLIERKPQEVKNKFTLVEKSPVQSKTKTSESLPIFQDVIHIPADKYGESTANTSSKTDNNASKGSVSVVKDVKDKLLKRIKVEGKKPLVIPGTIDLSNIRVVSVSSAALKSKQGQKEKVIDLTEHFPPQNDNAKKGTSVLKKDFVAIAGTSKDIIINNMGHLLTNMKNSPKKEIPNDSSSNKTTIRKNLTISLKKVSSSDSAKRSSPWQEPPATKKTKPNPTKPMTLQDFNIDDFDDIIELE